MSQLSFPGCRLVPHGSRTLRIIDCAVQAPAVTGIPLNVKHLSASRAGPADRKYPAGRRLPDGDYCLRMKLTFQNGINIMATRGLLCDAALLFNAGHAWDERVFVSTWMNPGAVAQCID
jgi:hypothetical protein